MNDEEQVFSEHELDAAGEPVTAPPGSPGDPSEPPPPAMKYYCAGANRKTEDGVPCCSYKAVKPWLGRCPSCFRWYNCEKIKRAATDDKLASAETLVAANTAPRFSLGFDWVDRVLGGGVYPHSCVLLGGDPGVGKTSLLYLIGNAIATKEHPVIFASGEDGSDQIGLYFERLNISNPYFKVIGIDKGGSDVDSIMEHVFASGPKPRLLMIDSAQTVCFDDVEGDAGSPSQVAALANFINDMVKTKKVPVMLVGQLDKSGFDFAGVAKLKYLVDALVCIEDLDDEIDPEMEGLCLLRVMKKSRLGMNNVRSLFRRTATGLEPVSEEEMGRGRRHSSIVTPSEDAAEKRKKKKPDFSVEKGGNVVSYVDELKARREREKGDSEKKD